MDNNPQPNGQRGRAADEHRGVQFGHGWSGGYGELGDEQRSREGEKSLTVAVAVHVGSTER
jgi:hypothetical protein